MVEALRNAKKRQLVNTFMLRARLVDRWGRLLRPAAVESIDFALLAADEETGEVWPLGVCALDPSDVVLDGLRNDDWPDDACGYNFRHCVDVGEFELASLPRQSEFRYVIRDTNGKISVVRFQIRGIKHD